MFCDEVEVDIGGVKVLVKRLTVKSCARTAQSSQRARSASTTPIPA